MTRSHDHDPAACEGCELTDGRRRFVASALAMAFAAALPVRLLHALDRRANEVRYPIPAGDSVSIDSTNEVIIVRWAGKAYAFNLACPHQHTALRWLDDAHVFQCPRHKSRYQPDGEFISGRATRGMDRLGVRKDGDQLVVDLSVMFKQDENSAGWGGAEVTL